MRGLILTVMAMLLLVSAKAYADPLEEGKAAMWRSDYAEAFKQYRLAVEQGNAEAEARLGYLYQHGDGVAKDEAKAINLFRAAASKGDGLGNIGLLQRIETGMGFRKISQKR